MTAAKVARINHKLGDNRTGTILVVALVVLTFVILLGAALVRSVVMFHQQAQLGQQRQQALLLAESAIQRATRAASTVADYQGETWHVPAQVLGDGAAGVVVIRMEKPAESAVQRRLIVEAVYPDQGTRRFVYRRELLIDLPVPSAPTAAAAANSAS